MSTLSVIISSIMEQKVSHLQDFVKYCILVQYDRSKINECVHTIEDDILKKLFFIYFGFDKEEEEEKELLLNNQFKMATEDEETVEILTTQMSIEEGDTTEIIDKNNDQDSTKSVVQRKKLHGKDLHRFLKKNIYFSNLVHSPIEKFEENYKNSSDFRSNIKLLLNELEKVNKLQFFGYCKLGIILNNYYKLYKESVSINKLPKKELFKKYFNIKPANGERLVWLGKLCIKYPAIKFINNINVTNFYKHRKEINNLLDEKNVEYEQYQSYWKKCNDD